MSSRTPVDFVAEPEASGYIGGADQGGGVGDCVGKVVKPGASSVGEDDVVGVALDLEPRAPDSIGPVRGRVFGKPETQI